MPLPFLKHKKQSSAGLSIAYRQPDGTAPIDHMEGDESQGLTSAAEDLCKAVESKDYKAIASALRAAFEILDSEPHEEGEHTNESEMPEGIE